MSTLVKAKLKIAGMHCSSCAMNIDFDLEDLEGVSLVKTNYARAETDIEFDSEKLQLNKILDQIEKTGYKANPISQ